MFDLHDFGGGIYLGAALMSHASENTDARAPQKVASVDLIELMEDSLW